MIQFSSSVVSDTLRPHGLQHARLPCPFPILGACSNSCPSSLWFHPTISSPVIPFSSHLQSFPTSGSFPESVLRVRWPKYCSPSNEHPGLISFRLDWLDLLAGQGTLKSLLQHHSSKASILRCSAFFTVLNIIKNFQTNIATYKQKGPHHEFKIYSTWNEHLLHARHDFKLQGHKDN